MKNKRIQNRVSIAGNLPHAPRASKNKQFEAIMKWAIKISQHPQLYSPDKNQISSNYHFYRVQFIEVSDIDVLLGKRKQYLQITGIIYNRQAQSFVGTTYSSQMFDIQVKDKQRPFASCQKSIYFYTELDDIVLKGDVWRLQSDKNGKGIQNMNKRVYVGGFEIKLGQSMQSGIIEKTLNKSQAYRFGIEAQQNLESEDNQQNQKKKTSKILLRVINSHSLTHLHHFIPPNHIFDCLDNILGLKENKIGADGEIEMGDRNRLNFEISSLSIPTSTIKYLTENAEQKIESTFAISGRATHTIKEVRLNFQFHNGWKSVCCQSLVLKQNIAQSTMIDGNKSMVPSKMQQKNAKLKQPVLKNKIYSFDKARQLKAVFEGDGGVLILWIEVKIESKFDLIDQKNNKKAKNQVFYLPLAFAVKSIPENQEQFSMNIELKCGNVYSLSNLAAYLSELKLKKKVNQANEDTSQKLICSMKGFMKKSGGTIENIETVQKQMNEIEALKVQKQRLARLRRKIKEEKRKKLIELNQQIPLLDTIQLKEQLYQEKIAKIRNQKLQQEQKLTFLKFKIHQMERQNLNNQLNYQGQMEDQDEQDERAIKIKKMPDNFIDYHPTPKDNQVNDSIVIKQFDASYCKMATSPPSSVSPNLLRSCVESQTFLQFKVTLFEIYNKEIQDYLLQIPNFQGQLQNLPLSVKDYSNKALSVKITFSSERTQHILNQLLNGFFTIFLSSSAHKKLKASSMITVKGLIQKCRSGDLLESIQKEYLFEQDGTLIGLVRLLIAFTNTSSNSKANDSPNKSKIKQNYSGAASIMNRINRFKQQKGLEDKKKINYVTSVISTLKVNKMDIFCRHLKAQTIKIIVNNSSNEKKSFAFHIFDDDSAYLAKNELTLLEINALSQNDLPPIIFKGNSFELSAHSSYQIVFKYLSSRANLNLAQIDHLEDKQSFISLKNYNHPHRININITETQTNIIHSRYQITINPEYQFNTFPIERFLSKAETITFPIVTSNIKLFSTNKDITQKATRLDLNVPKVRNSQLYLSNFLLSKESPEGNITFQNVNFYGWGSQQLQIDGRLWDKKDILIKIPLQAILERQVNVKYQIDHIITFSRHMDLKIRHLGGFQYDSTININRKNAEILIRAELAMNSIGKCTYGVQIADKSNQVFYRIGIFANVGFPAIAVHQIIPIKIPKESLDTSEPFSFKNRQEVGLEYELRCSKPHLLRFVEEKYFLKVDQEWKIEMLFDWNRIMGELLEEQKDEVSILIGIKSRLSIEYLLFKLKN